MALFNVEVVMETTMVVEAENDDEAYFVARANAKSAFADDYSCEPSVHVTGSVEKEAHLRNGWDADCVPYGGDNNTSIGEILAK